MCLLVGRPPESAKKAVQGTQISEAPHHTAHQKDADANKHQRYDNYCH